MQFLCLFICTLRRKESNGDGSKLVELNDSQRYVKWFHRKNMQITTCALWLVWYLWVQATVGRMKSSALEFFTAFVGKDKDAGVPSSALVTRHFLKEAAACLYDSKAEVRQDAQLAFQQVYKQLDQELLVHFVCLHQSTGQQRTILQVLFLAGLSYTVTSVAVIAELSLRSPRKLFISIIKKFYL